MSTVVADFSSAGYSNTSRNAKGKIINRFRIGECTWYCCGRAYERYGIALSPLLPYDSDAGSWYANIEYDAKIARVPASNGPVADSVAVMPGHVMYIESVSGSTVNFSECNWHIPNNNGSYDTSKGDGVLQSDTWEHIQKIRGTCKGFIEIR